MIIGSFVAHQGGWDEIMLVAGPLLVFAAVLFLANRRANAKLALAAQAAEQDEHEAEANLSADE